MLRILCSYESRRFRKCHPCATAALCTHGTSRQSQWRLRCLGVILEGTGVPGPQRCLNQTPSKGREAFAHRLPPGRVSPNTPTPSENRDITKKEEYTHTRKRRKDKNTGYTTQEERKVREEGKSQKSSPGGR